MLGIAVIGRTFETVIQLRYENEAPNLLEVLPDQQHPRSPRGVTFTTERRSVVS